MPRINGERLLADLRRIADFGRYQTGVHRPHLSPQDVESRHWLAGRMKEAGLEPVIDGVGNVIGRSPKSGPRLLMGSHTDTQPRGGWLDGVMGVIYGLEVARALAEDPETAHLAVDVASWADEEGHWGGMIGSKSLHRPHHRRRHRRRPPSRRRQQDARRAEGRRPRQGAARSTRGRPLSLLSRSPYRAGRPARGLGQAHRRRHGDRRHLPVSPDLQRHPEPCRHDAHADPQGCRRRHDAALQRGDGQVPRAGRPAQRVDRGQDVGRARRARHHPRQGRDDPAVPRRRPRRAAAPGGGAARDRRGTPEARTLHHRVRQSLAHHAGADGGAPARRASTRRRKSTRRASTCACRRAPATTRRSWRSACRRP